MLDSAHVTAPVELYYWKSFLLICSRTCKISTFSASSWYCHLFSFFNCIALISYHNCPNFYPFAPTHPAFPTPSGNTHTIVHVHGSCVQVLWMPPFLTVLASPWLLCNYLFVLLNPLTSLSIPLDLPPL